MYHSPGPAKENQDPPSCLFHYFAYLGAVVTTIAAMVIITMLINLTPLEDIDWLGWPIIGLSMGCGVFVYRTIYRWAANH